MPNGNDKITITFTLNPDDAFGFAQLVKRLHRRNLRELDAGNGGIVTNDEKSGAEQGLAALAMALHKAGYGPR